MAHVPAKPRQIGGNALLPSHGAKLRFGVAKISRNGPRYELCNGSVRARGVGLTDELDRLANLAWFPVCWLFADLSEYLERTDPFSQAWSGCADRWVGCATYELRVSWQNRSGKIGLLHVRWSTNLSFRTGRRSVRAHGYLCAPHFGPVACSLAWEEIYALRRRLNSRNQLRPKRIATSPP